MARLIDGDMLISKISITGFPNIDRNGRIDKSYVYDLINSLPTVEERPKGAWEMGGFCFSAMSYKCPFCKSKTLERTKFCSECGADMREAE